MTTRTRTESIAAVEVPDCPLCAAPGEELHARIRDVWLQTPGSWRILHCRPCRLAWMSPKPELEELGKLYGDGYHTHAVPPSGPKPAGILRRIMREVTTPFADVPTLESQGRMERLAVARLGATAAIRDLAQGALMWIDQPPGDLLDVGCGNGEFLVRMRERGWIVRGIEPDPASARIATDHHSLEVTTGTLEDAAMAASSVDVVTMSHVIEHVHDPVRALGECARILRPGGRVVVVTPNLRSLGRSWFGKRWLGWDVPRHLHVFSPESLRTCVDRAGLEIVTLKTTARSAFRQIPSMPRFIAMQRATGTRDRARFLSLGWWLVEHAMTRIIPCGEEILLIARRPR